MPHLQRPRPPTARFPSLHGIAACACAAFAFDCSGISGMDVPLSKREALPHRLALGQRVPDAAEATTIGALDAPVVRGTRAFSRLVRYDGADVLFKDEEGTSADRMMTPRLKERVSRLAVLVQREWPDLSLRVTEAWDDSHEHGGTSIHYEGRAADVTTSDVDPRKLGRLARLAVDAGFGWVFYENTAHVHVSVARD